MVATGGQAKTDSILSHFIVLLIWILASKYYNLLKYTVHVQYRHSVKGWHRQ